VADYATRVVKRAIAGSLVAGSFGLTSAIHSPVEGLLGFWRALADRDFRLSDRQRRRLMVERRRNRLFCGSPRSSNRIKLCIDPLLHLPDFPGTRTRVTRKRRQNDCGSAQCAKGAVFHVVANSSELVRRMPPLGTRRGALLTGDKVNSGQKFGQTQLCFPNPIKYQGSLLFRLSKIAPNGFDLG
jgi:hypothetical protein